MTATPASIAATTGSTLMVGGFASLSLSNSINNAWARLLALFGQPVSELVSTHTAIAATTVGTTILVLSIVAWTRRRR